MSARRMKPLTDGKKKQVPRLLAEHKLHEAKALLERVCQVAPRDVDAWMQLANVSAQMDDPGAVEHCCRTIISIRPELADAHLMLGNAHLMQGAREQSVESLRQALRLRPDHPPTIHLLGKALHLLARFDEALDCYQRALWLAPDAADIRASMDAILKYRGQSGGDGSAGAENSRANSNYDRAHSDLLLHMNYSHRYAAEAIYQEHMHWGRAHTLLPSPISEHANGPEPERRLRIGYVSPDFCNHSISFFIEPLLCNHAPAMVETFCYSDVAKPDAATQRLRKAAAHWRSIVEMDNVQLVKLIGEDAIDILVDLSGHTANCRLLAFTAKPAPVQVTYLGYPNTTGIPAIDYRLTDAWADPPGLTDAYNIETLIRLPDCFLCYLPPEEAPPVARSEKQRDRVVFCSFNNLDKITPEVVSLWASVLRSVPGSGLVIKNGSLKDQVVRERLYARFAVNGISRDRLDLRGPIYDIADHLALYNEVDIALDTFPYNGTTTTCEALWMGVPVISLAGSMHAGRVGVSLLSQVGLSDLIAESPQEYVRLATELAADTERVSALRTTLRDRMARSPLCNGEAFARKVESAYRGMWRNYCGQRLGVNHG